MGAVDRLPKFVLLQLLVHLFLAGRYGSANQEQLLAAGVPKHCHVGRLVLGDLGEVLESGRVGLLLAHLVKLTITWYEISKCCL